MYSEDIDFINPIMSKLRRSQKFSSRSTEWQMGILSDRANWGTQETPEVWRSVVRPAPAVSDGECQSRG
jgi:hypothetical protein